MERSLNLAEAERLLNLWPRPYAGAVVEGSLRRDAERNRQRILDAARRLYAESGLRASHDDVARAAGVGVGTVYRRFPDRESLQAAVFDRQLDEVVRLAEAAQARPDPWPALRDFLVAVLELQAGDKGLRDLLAGAPDASAAAGRARGRIAPVVGDMLGRAQREGRVRPDLTVTDLSLVPVMVGAIIEATRAVDPDQWRRTLALLLDGLEPRPGAGPLPAAALSPAAFDQVLGGG